MKINSIGFGIAIGVVALGYIANGQRTFIQNFQIVQDAALNVLNLPARTTNEEILTAVDDQFDTPLRMYATAPTADAVLNIGPNVVQLGDGSGLSTPPQDGVISDFAVSTVNYQTGATTGNTIQVDGAAFALPTCTVGQFRRHGYVYNAASNLLNSTFGAQSPTEGALVQAGGLFDLLDGIPIGHIVLECTNVSGQYKTAGSATDIIENQVSGNPKIFKFGFGGGGASSGAGGSSVQWNAPAGQAPIDAEENGELVYLYESGLSQKLVSFIKVPAGHKVTKQIKLKAAIYSPSTSNNGLMTATAYLIRPNIDAVTATGNSHVSTNSAITFAAPSESYRAIELDLTDSDGEINGIGVVEGTIIRVELTRGTDTDTEDVRFVPSATEMEF